MALAETATLIVNMMMKSTVAATAKSDKATLGDLGKTVLGLAGAAGFGALTVGAMGAQKAQGQFMAATGASREEAKKFVSDMDGLAGTAGAVGLAFDDIYETGINVAQQFGTTGQKTQDLTADILEFSKITGGDAKQNAKDLEDTISAYGLSADDAAGFMDELVLSNQKFGTDVGPEALGVLQNMAPAVQALGGNAEDAVGFLNLMETAGLDAGGALRGLNTAAANAPDGTTLAGLYDHLASIEDQGDRTKEAVRLFGTQAGVKLAQAIQPGQGALKDFEVQGDSTGQHLHDTAAGMETDAEKVRGAFDKVIAGIREVGQDVGPALAGLGGLVSLVSPMSKQLGDVLKKVVALVLPTATAQGVLVGEAEAVGQAEGATGANALARFLTKFGLMTPAKVAAATAAGAVEGTAEGAAAAEAAGAAFASKLPGFLIPLLGAAGLAGGAVLGGGVALAGSAAITDAAKGDNSPIGNAFHPWEVAGLKAGTDTGTGLASSLIDAVASHISSERIDNALSPIVTVSKTTGTQSASTFADAFTHSDEWKSAGNSGAQSMSLAFGNALVADAGVQARIGAKQAAAAFSQEVLSHRGEAQDAWTQFVNMMKHPLDTAAEIAELKGDLASKKMIRGLASNDPQVRQWAENTRDAIQQRINDLEKLLGQDGTDAGAALKTHLAAQYTQILSDARGTVSKLNAIYSDLKTHYTIVIDQTGAGHGGNSGVPGRAAGGWVDAGSLYRVNENHTEWFRPAVSGTVLPLAPSGSSSYNPPPINIKIAVSAREINERSRHFATLSGSVAE